MKPLQSVDDRILARRAEDACLLRRGPRAIAVSSAGTWLELSRDEQRLFVELERPQPLGSPALLRLGLKPQVLYEAVQRFYECRLVALNGRLCPTGERSAVADLAPSRVPLDDLENAAGAVLVEIGLDPGQPVFEALLKAMQRGVVAIPVVVARRPQDFTAAFDVLAARGFRLFRVEPAHVETDERAVDLADGMLAMTAHAAVFARSAPARFRISGLDAWLRRLCGDALPSAEPHARCARCTVRGWCRPDSAWPLEHGAAGSPACAFSRRMLEELVWMVADAPDLPSLLAGS